MCKAFGAHGFNVKTVGPKSFTHSYITRPISIFVDELVKPSITMPTVLRDSGELIQCLENVELPADCLLTY